MGLNKEELFEDAYNAVMLKSEFASYDVNDDDGSMLSEEYENACIEANDSLGTIEESGLLNEYIDWINKNS